ncbi:MAG: response regulator, partial [Panacagrimonas sp.]
MIVRLTIIGEVFASAVARARSEEEAGKLRGRLWHADRVARVSALTAAIAHEINQPLTAILSNAEAGLAHLGRGEARPEEMHRILEAVVRADKRAAETIRTVRGLLRREEGSRERIDLALALREVVQLLGAELGRKGIPVELAVEPGGWVNADKTQIEQVALNLVQNAAAAMESCAERARALRVSVARTGNGNAAVEVRDSGIGIPGEHIEKVFEPFWTTRKDGLGLGLAICRSIVEAHGGAIGVTPNPDRGVTFRFELACDAGAAEAEAAHPPEPASARAATPAAAAWPVVCVIDDDEAVRTILVRLLAGEGWATAAYASAAEFLERQPFAAVGCILLDNQMPGMSGLELQQHMAERGAAPPVVFFTGHGELETGVHAMKLGAMDFLVKPVEAGVLTPIVRKALARHAAERDHAREREGYRERLGRLTAREHEVMVHVVRGRLNKQIAADLD